MARRYYSTTAQRTTLASSCTDSATTIVVTAATGFPSSTPFPLVLDADTVNEEAVLVTSRVGTTCTVTRAYDGTTGVAHSAGATVRHTALALDFNEASEHVFETTTAHGLTLADVLTTTNTKTSTNKTFTSPTLTTPTIADFTNAQHDHGDADDGGTLPASSVLNRPLNDQSGTTYTFVLADARKHTIASNAGTKTFTIPLQAAVTWLADAKIIVTNTGAGELTIAITATGTLNGSDLTLAQGESAALLRTASDVWWCLPFSSASAAVPRGTISGTTDSPATSANGGATAYKWTSSGSVTVDVAGLFTLRMAGGGGGGGKSGAIGAGGGGGGGVFESDVYLTAGTYTVTVGQGGQGGQDEASGINGESSSLGEYTAPGGGGGGGRPTSSPTTASNGGSGGGGGSEGAGAVIAGGAGTTGLGNAGGTGYGSATSTQRSGGGGGGAGGAGTNGTINQGGAGGAGVASSITGASVTLGGGGGGSAGSTGSAGAGGSGGGGAGFAGSGAGVAGTANTGGGGGGAPTTGPGGAGGSGVVVLLVGTV